MKKILLIATLLAAAAPMPALADGPLKARTAEAEAQSLAADRASILAMAGDYKVTFDMRETTPWRTDYTPIDPKTSGGHEAVRVIEDSDRRIVLQHLLVVKDKAGKSIVIKHWRQDWTYEPESVLVYAGKGRWNVEAVPAAMRSGRWSHRQWVRITGFTPIRATAWSAITTAMCRARACPCFIPGQFPATRSLSRRRTRRGSRG